MTEVIVHQNMSCYIQMSRYKKKTNMYFLNFFSTCKYKGSLFSYQRSTLEHFN
jgi:hypothetical protein